MPALWIGTSGWVYRHWLGVFYPPDLPSERQLPFYAEHFSSVEVNFSFYRLPERTVFETWRRQTPDGFLFAVKGSRYLTHMKKLKDPEEPLGRLMERAGGLGPKLGPILFQFPHTWRANVERLAHFLEALEPYRRMDGGTQEYPENPEKREGRQVQEGEQRFAFEFRHQSWLVPQVYKLLEGIGAALCLPLSPHVPLDIRLTAPWTYIRMHGGQHGIGYDDELHTWADHIQRFRGQGADVHVYFNNDPEGHAIRDAARLHEMLA